MWTTDGEKNIYKLAKIRKFKTIELNCDKCIKDEDQRMLTKEVPFELELIAIKEDFR